MSPPARPRAWVRVSAPVWVALVSVVLVGILFLAIYPTQTWLRQRADTERATEQLEVIEARNAELEGRIAELRTPGEIEAIAREHHHLVRPGEEAYAVLPPPEPQLDLPELWPFAGLEDHLGG